MSPRIGMALDVSDFVPDSAEAFDQVRTAIRIAHSQGFEVVRTGDYHEVRRNRWTGGWTPGRIRDPRRLDLRGAICYALQPLDGVTADAGAAAVLEVAPLWLAGLVKGWEAGSASDPSGELAAGPARALYRDGLRAGRSLFEEFFVLRAHR